MLGMWDETNDIRQGTREVGAGLMGRETLSLPCCETKRGSMARVPAKGGTMVEI